MYFDTLVLILIVIGILVFICGLIFQKFDTTDDCVRWFGLFSTFFGVAAISVGLVIAVLCINYTVTGTICKMYNGDNGMPSVMIDDVWYYVEVTDYRDLAIGDTVTFNVVEYNFIRHYYKASVLEAPKHTGECGGLTTCNCNCSFVKGV